MSDNDRFTPYSQEEQVELLHDTGNGPTDTDEETVLADLYGPPDADGVYGPRDASGLEGGDA